MRLLIEIAAAVLFVVSTGLLFSEAVRARQIVFVAVGIVALASSYVITKTVLDATVGHRLHHRHTATLSAAAPSAPTATAPATEAIDATPSATDNVLEAIYSLTESTLNRIVRAGTKQSSASVSSDTVVDVIVGLTIAVLGLLSQVLSGLVRRVFGAA